MTPTIASENQATIAPGAAAPNATLADSDGQIVRLSTIWSTASRALALVFVRHFG